MVAKIQRIKACLYKLGMGDDNLQTIGRASIQRAFP
jgi:hypothetical protein